MRNKTLLTIMLGMFILLFSISSVSAEDSLGTFEKGECVELKQTCASCSYVNFSQVTYPNGTQALGNVQADKDGSIYNYTFCNTSETGEYNVYGIGDLDNEDTVFAYDFEIVPSTDSVFSLDNFNSNISLIIFILLFVIAGAFYYVYTPISALLIIVNGFIMVTNGINPIVSTIVIMIGVLVAFIEVKGGNE